MLAENNKNFKGEYKNINILDKKYVWIHTEKTAKFENDLFKVAEILNKGIENLTAIDHINLLSIYRPAYHDSGKIEGITSFDSTATNCGFCELMRDAAKNNPLHICNYCYDFAQEHGFKGVNVLNRHTLNMIIMSFVEFSIEELKLLNVSYINRINSSGDVPNEIYARNMIKLCFAFPALHFAFWAKNTKPVISACDVFGKPDNLVLIQSSPIIGKPAKLEKYFDFVFTVYLTKEDVENAVNNGAGECNGKRCKDCGYSCYIGTWKKLGIVNVAEYLRIPGIKDNQRKERIAAKKTA